MGVEVKMITGDHVTIAVETARALGLGTRILGPTGLPVLQEGGRVPDKCAPPPPAGVRAPLGWERAS